MSEAGPRIQSRVLRVQIKRLEASLEKMRGRELAKAKVVSRAMHAHCSTADSTADSSAQTSKHTHGAQKAGSTHR